MRTKAVLTILIILLLTVAAEGKKARFYEKGTLVEMNSASCGYDEKGAKDITGEILGTDSDHRKTKQLLCPEYVLRSEKVDYRIRPKDDKHPRLLPIGSDAEFRIEKDKMMMRVPERDEKERQYIVVSMMPRNDAKTTTAASAEK